MNDTKVFSMTESAPSVDGKPFRKFGDWAPRNPRILRIFWALGILGLGACSPQAPPPADPVAPDPASPSIEYANWETTEPGGYGDYNQRANLLQQDTRSTSNIVLAATASMAMVTALLRFD